MAYFFTNEILFWALVVVGVVAITDAVWLFFITKKLTRLLGGSQAKDITESLGLIRKELDKTKSFKNEINAYLETVETRLKRSVQSVETIRFNPFKGTGDGGNQSFSTSFIDENGKGVVVSGLYSRDRVSVFSKAIEHFDSSFELTEEEKEIIKRSEKNLAQLTTGPKK